MKNHGEGVNAAASRQPQINSAWARQQVALIKKQLGPRWESDLVKGRRRPRMHPLRAAMSEQLESTATLRSVSHHLAADPGLEGPSSQCAPKAARDGHSQRRSYRDAFERNAQRRRSLVQRMVCEALARSGQAGPVPKLVNLLAEAPTATWPGRRFRPGSTAGRPPRVAGRGCCEPRRFARFSAAPWDWSPCIPTPKRLIRC